MVSWLRAWVVALVGAVVVDGERRDDREDPTVVRGVADGLSLPPYRFFLGARGAFGRLLLLGEVVLSLVVRAVLFLPRAVLFLPSRTVVPVRESVPANDFAGRPLVWYGKLSYLLR